MGQGTSSDRPIKYDKLVHLTYSSIDRVPSKVFEGIRRFASGYDVRFYDDTQCLRFLEDHFTPVHAQRFRELKSGAHKADLFRYCVLYVHGGIYMDIKTVLTRHLDEVFDRTYNYTCTSPFTHIYNGIMATEKRNPVIRACIQRMIVVDKAEFNRDYGINCAELFRQLRAHNITVRHGPSGDWFFLQENCLPGIDRYNMNCTIVDHRQRIMFRTRYDDFPW